MATLSLLGMWNCFDVRVPAHRYRYEFHTARTAVYSVKQNHLFLHVVKPKKGAPVREDLRVLSSGRIGITDDGWYEGAH